MRLKLNSPAQSTRFLIYRKGLDRHPKSVASFPLSRLDKRGVGHRHEREAGCDGRGWRRKTSGTIADGQGVWSWRPDAGVKLAGDDLQATVAKEPGHRGERVIGR